MLKKLLESMKSMESVKYEVMGSAIAEAIHEAHIPIVLAPGGLSFIGRTFSLFEIAKNTDKKVTNGVIMDISREIDVLAESIKGAIAKPTVGKSFDDIIAALFTVTLDMVKLRDKQDEGNMLKNLEHKCDECANMECTHRDEDKKAEPKTEEP